MNLSLIFKIDIKNTKRIILYKDVGIITDRNKYKCLGIYIISRFNKKL